METGGLVANKGTGITRNDSLSLPNQSSESSVELASSRFRYAWLVSEGKKGVRGPELKVTWSSAWRWSAIEQKLNRTPHGKKMVKPNMKLLRRPSSAKLILAGAYLCILHLIIILVSIKYRRSVTINHSNLAKNFCMVKIERFMPLLRWYFNFSSCILSSVHSELHQFSIALYLLIWLYHAITWLTKRRCPDFLPWRFHSLKPRLFANFKSFLFSYRDKYCFQN